MFNKLLYGCLKMKYLDELYFLKGLIAGKLTTNCLQRSINNFAIILTGILNIVTWRLQKVLPLSLSLH